MVANTMEIDGWIDDPDPGMDELDELKRIAQRDEAAFESLYRRYHPKLFRFVQRITNNPAQVEEIVSDTLYAVWNSADRFQQKSKVSTWIFGIGYRTALKSVRSNKRYSRFTRSGDDPEALMDSSTTSDPSIEAEISDKAKRVLAAVEALSPKQKAVVELTALGWSCAEIGEIVDCPANTVKTRMFSARKKLLSSIGSTEV
jgi:RNA polymerase sigma-70 factor (ECF subfamily)